MAEQLATEQRNEIASIRRDINYPQFLGVLNPNDDTLATRGAALSYRIYDDIERDCQAYGDLSKRKLAVVAREWQVDPASEAPLDKRAADIVRAQLKAMGAPRIDAALDTTVIAAPGNFDTVCYHLLDALLKGFAVGEVMWDTDGREIVAREIRPRDQRRFAFDLDLQLRLRTRENLIYGIAVPPRKFVVHSFGAKDGNPHGLGLGSRLFWPVFFKRQDMRFWLTFLDKFGSPTSVGKYPAGTPKGEQEALLEALGAISQDTGIAIPDNMLVELLEATRGGNAGYETMARYLDEQISLAVLGEAAGGKNSGGALASAAILRNEVRLELVQADADLLSATLNSTLAAWITAYNVRGANPPRISRIVKAAEDLKARSERDRNLYGIGYRPTLAQVTETYGGEWEPVPRAAPTGLLPGSEPEFAEADAAAFPDQAAIDAAIAAAPGAQLDAAMRALLAPVVRMLADGGTPDSAEEWLANAFPQLAPGQLVELLARAIFVADVWGRISAEREQA